MNHEWYYACFRLPFNFKSRSKKMWWKEVLLWGRKWCWIVAGVAECVREWVCQWSVCVWVNRSVNSMHTECPNNNTIGSSTSYLLFSMTMMLPDAFRCLTSKCKCAKTEHVNSFALGILRRLSRRRWLIQLFFHMSNSIWAEVPLNGSTKNSFFFCTHFGKFSIFAKTIQ